MEALVFGSAQQHTTAGVLDSCGVVLVAVEKFDGAPVGKLLMFNGSFSIGAVGAGLVKGRAAEIDAKLLVNGKAKLTDAKPLPTVNVWMKGPDKPATHPLVQSPLQNSEDPGYLIYGTSLDSALGLLESVVAERPIQLGVRIKGRNFDQALFGVVQMTNGQREQFDQCVGELLADMERKLKDSKGASGTQTEQP